MGTEDTVNDTITTLALITPKLYLGNVRRKNIKFDINVIDKIYYDRADRLAASGIKVGKTEFENLMEC